MRLKRNIVRQLERAIANDDMSLIKSIENVLKKLLEKPENFETETGHEFDYVNYLAKDDIFYQISFAQIKEAK